MYSEQDVLFEHLLITNKAPQNTTFGNENEEGKVTRRNISIFKYFTNYLKCLLIRQ